MRGVGADAVGATPGALRLGVTGHRDVAAGAALREQIHRAVDVARRAAGRRSGAAPSRLVVVSSLAEGADRLVARALLEDSGATLEAVLPLPTARYRDDFRSEESRREFAHLMGQACAVVVAPPAGGRAEAYEWAGRYVVDHCDVLIAVWDGRPARGRGGTAEVLTYARSRRLPVVVIGAVPPYEVAFRSPADAGEEHQMSKETAELLRRIREDIARCLTIMERATTREEILLGFAEAERILAESENPLAEEAARLRSAAQAKPGSDVTRLKEAFVAECRGFSSSTTLWEPDELERLGEWVRQRPERRVP